MLRLYSCLLTKEKLSLGNINQIPSNSPIIPPPSMFHLYHHIS
jgi:hypothetical protein